MAERPFITLKGIIVVAIVLGILAAILVPQVLLAVRNAKRGVCSWHLRSLAQLQFNYAAQYGRPNGDMPEETGTAFFLRLQRTPKPMVDNYIVFICPQSEDEPGPGICSYRGPAVPVRQLTPEDPWAADKEGNHGPGNGGSLLTGKGDVREYEESDPLWLRARVTTKE